MGEPNEFVREIHTRMPIILLWLSGETGKEIPFPADQVKAWPISPRVNCPKTTTLRFIATGRGLNSGHDLTSDPCPENCCIEKGIGIAEVTRVTKHPAVTMT
jgi:hypothetical protein